MKQQILKWTIIAATIINISFYASAANVAADIVAKAIDKYQSVPSLTVNFKISAPGADTASGTLISAGDRFKLEMSGIQTWYDGRTQWTYMPSVNEVNITEPTADELAQINPFAIVSAIKGSFTPVLISSGAKGHIVRFTPSYSTSSDLRSMTVAFDPTTSWPQRIEIASGTGTAVITVTSVKTGGKLPAATFVYNKKAHPGVEIVDLR